MTSELKCPLCGHNAKDDGLNNTWYCSNQYCDSYEENSSKPYNALMNAIQDLEIARNALESISGIRGNIEDYYGGVSIHYQQMVLHMDEIATNALAQIDHIADASKMVEHKE